MFERSWIKIIPFGLLALLTVLAAYDPTIDVRQLENAQVTQVAEISTQELSNNKIKELHIVKSGENLSVIFEKYKVSLNKNDFDTFNAHTYNNNLYEDIKKILDTRINSQASEKNKTFLTFTISDKIL